MPVNDDAHFLQQREKTFDTVITILNERVRFTTPVVVLHTQEKSPETLRANAEKEVWSLFLNGIRHLKNGAPNERPGSMPEALSRTSLRASPFAAALGIRPPQFEPIYFTIDYTTGHEAVLFLCRRLIEGSESDFAKSRQIIQQKILTEKPAEGVLKEQMALSFDVLAETYLRACSEIKSALTTI